MKQLTDDRDNRLPVWRVLSEFFVDNEPDIETIATVCAESPYSLAELDYILFREVWPAFAMNLSSIAGNWTGWSDEILVQQIEKSHQPKKFNGWWLNPRKVFYCSDWFAVRRLIKRKRL